MTYSDFQKIVLKELKINSINENKTYLEKKLNMFFNELFNGVSEAIPLTKYEADQLRNYLSNITKDKISEIMHIINYRIVPYFERIKKAYKNNSTNMKNASFINYRVNNYTMYILNKNNISKISDLTEYTNEEIKLMFNNSLSEVQNLAGSLSKPQYKGIYPVKLMDDYVNEEIISKLNITTLGSAIKYYNGALSDKDKETLLQYGFFKAIDILETPYYVFESIDSLTQTGKANIKSLKNKYVEALSKEKCQRDINYAIENTGYININIDICDYKKLGSYLLAIRDYKFGYSAKMLSRLALHTDDDSIIKDIENGSTEAVYSENIYQDIFNTLELDEDKVKEVSNFGKYRSLNIDLNKEINEDIFNIFEDSSKKKASFKSCLELQKIYISLLNCKKTAIEHQNQVETKVKNIDEIKVVLDEYGKNIGEYERKRGIKNGRK